MEEKRNRTTGKKNNSRNVRGRLQCLTYEQISIRLTSKNRTTDHMGTASEKKMQATLKIRC